MSTHAKNVATLKATREALIARAIAERKIAPDRADDYRRMFDASPEGVINLLTAPVEDGGLMAGLAAHENPLPTDYPREWLRGSRPSGAVAFEDAATAVDGAALSLPPQPKPQAPYPDHGSRPVAGRVTVEP